MDYEVKTQRRGAKTLRTQKRQEIKIGGLIYKKFAWLRPMGFLPRELFASSAPLHHCVENTVKFQSITSMRPVAVKAVFNSPDEVKTQRRGAKALRTQRKTKN
ncbi:MAG: hypothetical protein R6X06_09525 [Gammaproteobacteria bacterium]